MPILIRSTLLGLTAGLRDMTPIAALSWGLCTGRLKPPSRLRLLARPEIALALLAAALGEVAVDKLPFVPPRTLPPVAAWRMATGAFTAGALAASEGESAARGVAVGAIGAAIGTYGGLALRKLVGRRLPEPFPGTLEDAVAVAVALRVTRR